MAALSTSPLPPLRPSSRGRSQQAVAVAARPFPTQTPKTWALPPQALIARQARSDHVHAGDIDLADAAPEDVGTAAAGTSADASRADHIHGGGGAGSLSSADPEDVGEAADDGTGTNASKSDHVHRLPVQNTLQFNNAGAVGVSIARVVEHLQQNIRYYTGEEDYSTDGSAAGHVYTTSRFPKNISRVTAHLTPPTVESDDAMSTGRGFTQ